MTIDFSKKLEEIFPGGIVGIIFDCDGVMIDSENANRAFYNIILHSLGLPSLTKDQEKYAFMATSRQAFQVLLPEQYRSKIEDLIRDNVDYEKDVLPKIRLMPDFEKFIKKCRSFSIKLAIDTNRTDYGIERVLQFFNIEAFFHPVISSTGNAPKPSPEGALKICAEWRASPAKVLFIGDSENDKKTANGAGAVFCAFRNRELSGELEVNNFRELGELLFPFVEKTSN